MEEQARSMVEEVNKKVTKGSGNWMALDESSGSGHGLVMSVVQYEEMIKKGMGLISAVGQCAVSKPRIIVLHYAGYHSLRKTSRYSFVLFRGKGDVRIQLLYPYNLYLRVDTLLLTPLTLQATLTTKTNAL
jgi:leucyl aminopeptidase